MQPLSYFRPHTLQEALELMERHAGCIKPYAGGTDLMVQLRGGEKKLAGIRYLLDLGALDELRAITVGGGAARVGAMATHTAVCTSPQLAAAAPFLCRAASQVGSPQIRNAGTVGGNICNASPAADTLSPFVALDARLALHSVKGVRSVLVKDLYLRAGRLSVEANEVATAIEFTLPAGYGTAFLKLGRRKALAISRMNAAAALKIEGGVIMDARIVPGCVFAVPDRVEKAERHLLGKAPSRQLFSECGALVSEVMIERTGVRWSTEYKRPVVEALVRRALTEAAGLEPEEA